MKKTTRKFLSIMLVAVMVLSTAFNVTPVKAASDPSGVTVTGVGGWNETLYMQISGISDSNVTAVSYSGPVTGSLTGDDLTYLVRDNNGGVRIDIPGLKAGTYSITVTTSKGTVTRGGIIVEAQDRSGYAHFNYTKGVGAYNDDGTLKKNAIVLYVTDANKNTVTLSYGGTTVTGIGNILNTAGMAVDTGLTSKGGKPNTNQDILKKLADANIPLVVRFIGCVSDSGLYKQGTFAASSTPKIDGLTIYDSVDYGGSEGDNGHMARMRSGKDITIEGIGYDATIDGWGFHFICSTTDKDTERGTSFEVRNLTFINTPEDAVGMEGTQGILKADGTVTGDSSTTSDILGSVERCWVHNCEFYCPSISGPAESDKAEGDGSVDFKRGQYFTCSYNYFEGCHKTNLVGSSDSSLQFNLTYHHNYWKTCGARGPLARNANIHMYNNVFEGQTDYCMNPRATAYIFSEYNLFYKCKNPQEVAGGALKSYNDCFTSCIGEIGGTVVANKNTTVSNSCKFSYRGIDYSKFELDSTLSYIPTGDYAIQEDIVEARKYIAAYNGTMPENPVSASDVKMSDFSVITAIGATPTEITSFPFEAAPGKISKQVYAFKVSTPITVSVTFSNGVLVNEAGVAVLEESGEVTLPAGAYAIQPLSFNCKAFDQTDFKEVTISSIKITAADPDYDPNKLTGISLNKTSATLLANATTKLTVSYTPSSTTDDKTVTWTTSNASVATVNDGLVTAKATGTAVITAKVGEFTATCTITVSEPVELKGISLNKASMSLEAGKTETLTVTYNPSNTTDNTDVTWTTGNASVATVNEGVVTAVGAGATTITAQVGSYTATCTVTVTVPKVPEGTYTHIFEKDGTSSDFYTFSTTSTSDSKGSVTLNGTTYEVCLKMQSSTTVTFDALTAGTLTLGFCSGCSSKTVYVDETSYSLSSSQVLTVDVAAGKHTVKKNSGESYLYYIIFTPEGSADGSEEHTHSYTSSVTKAATCIATGVRTYTCSCGDSYTEEIAKTAHTYSSEWTIDVQATATTEGSKSHHCTTSGCTAKADVTVIPATGSAEKLNGLVKVNGVWGYYVDGVVDTSYTGLADYSGAKWYVVKGVLSFRNTGLYKIGSSYYYIENGKWNESYTGLADVNGATWYVVDGKISFKTNGTVVVNGVTYTVSGGKVTEAAGLQKIDGTYYYVANGKVDTTYTGLAEYNGAKWYVVKGVLSFRNTGLYKIDGSYYYIEGGKWNENFTGLADANGATWYVVDGKISFKTTGTVVVNGVTYNVSGGKVTETAGLQKIDGTYYYVVNGEVDTTYTGLTEYNGAKWYVVKGVLSFRNTGLYKIDGSYYYIEGGKWNENFIGLADANGAIWYVIDGKIAFGTSGKVVVNGVIYTVSGGKVVE